MANIEEEEKASIRCTEFFEEEAFTEKVTIRKPGTKIMRLEEYELQMGLYNIQFSFLFSKRGLVIKKAKSPRKSPRKNLKSSKQDEAIDDVTPENTSPSESETSPMESEPLFVEQTAIKRDTVFEDVTEEQQAIIQQRLADHQRRFKEHEERQKKQMQGSTLR